GPPASASPRWSASGHVQPTASAAKRMRTPRCRASLVARLYRWSTACTPAGRAPIPGEDPMFSLKIVDHVRLDSERVGQNYMVHAVAAERIVRVITISRIGLVVLLAVAASA